MTTELAKVRNFEVVKSNDLIRKSRHQFSVQQQKALLYIISQIKPNQKDFEFKAFDISEFCEVCGISVNGKNYADLKEALQDMRNKSMWIRTPDGADTLVGWLSKVKIEPKKGEVQIRLDEDMKPFLLELRASFTKYSLLWTLRMKSKYSIRLYELLKSYQNLNEKINLPLDFLKERIGSEYERWVDVKRFCIETAIKEINEQTDLKVSYQIKKKGRAVDRVIFTITELPPIEQVLKKRDNNQALNGQEKG